MEYVSFNPAQREAGINNLAQSQAELGRIISKYVGFLRLRQEEISLKRLLYRKVSEITTELQKLHSLLPPISIRRLGLIGRGRPSELGISRIGRRSLLEFEVDVLKQRIMNLGK